MARDRASPVQLPLGLSFAPRTTFAAYFTGPNGLIVDMLRALAQGEGEDQVYMVGQPGLGKSHLMQATCRAANDHGRTAVYVPLRDLEALDPHALTGLEQAIVLCLDDIDAVAGLLEWEEALFDLINRARSRACRLVLAARSVPHTASVDLPDLGSRLAAGPVVRLEPLSDEQKKTALTERARTLGIDLRPAVADYLIGHYPRDLASQLERLSYLDRASLAAGRRLTVPFVKDVLE
jgi:DnaA family protein